MQPPPPIDISNPSTAFSPTGTPPGSPLPDTNSSRFFMDVSRSLRSHSLFINASDSFIAELATRLHYRAYQPGDTIVREGDIGRAMFLILKGHVNVASKDGEVVYADLGPGKFFGEIGVLFEIPRTANVVAKTKTFLATLTCRDMNEILMMHPDIAEVIRMEAEERYRVYRETAKRRGVATATTTTTDAEIMENNSNPMLDAVPDFQMVPVNVFEKLVEQYPTETVESKTILFEIGAPATNFLYIIREGNVSIMDHFKNAVARLGPHCFFGESSVMFKTHHLQTASADSDLKIIKIPVDHISPLLEDNPDFNERFSKSAKRNFNIWKINRVKAELLANSGVTRSASSTDDSPLTNLLRGRRVSSDIIIASPESMSNDTPLPQTFIPHQLNLMTASQLTANETSRAQSHIDLATSENIKSVSRLTSTHSLASTLSSNAYSNSGPSISLLPNYSVKPQSPKETESESSDDVMDDEDVQKRQIWTPLNTLRGLETGKRRASIAVWSDQKLSDLAMMNAEKGKAGQKIPTNRFAETVASSRASETGSESAQVDEQNPASIGEDVKRRAFELVLSKMTFVEVWKLRAVSKMWMEEIRSSIMLMKLVDLSHYNKLVSDDVLEMVARFVGPKLSVLVLKNCWKVTDRGLLNLSTYCNRLEVADLCGCWDITDAGLGYLSRCSFLRSIDLSNCRKVSDQGLEVLMKNCLNLNDLFLSYCKNLTDKTLSKAAEFCPNLHRLNFQRCIGITDKGYGLFNAQQHFKLQELIISDCSFLTDTAIRFIASSCPNLRILNVSFCCALTENAVIDIAKCSRLTTLDISFCGSAISDKTLYVIATELKDLHGLSVRGCVRVSDEGVKALIQYATNLRMLNISSCRLVTDQILKEVPLTWKLLGAQTPVIEPVSITHGDVFSSSQLRRFTAP